MSLLSLRNVFFRHQGPWLLEDATLHLKKGEKACLLGRNGVGKSTLLKMLDGAAQPEEGTMELAPGTRIAYLPQEVPKALQGTVYQVVEEGLLQEPRGPEVSENGSQRIDAVISRLGLEPGARTEELSAGWKRRVLLARALVRDPELLLLDEPTNHLDIEAIRWLESFLGRYRGAVLFTTHDRAFLRSLAQRIFELDRGKLTSWDCPYEVYLQRKDASLAAEEERWAQFDKKLAKEEAWIRRGIRARRTRNEGRVRALKKMRQERVDRREVMGTARLRSTQGSRSGRLVIQAEGVSFGYEPGAPVVTDFSTVVLKGDRVGLMGKNGTGKTTLLRLLMGDLTPERGEVKLGTHLEIAYFDQLHGELDEDLSVQENLGQGSETILIDGQARHVLGYLQDFLFPPERSRSPVSQLSGGERNRLQLAKLFARPANVLVFDEPTNDLDTETLELLEELLLEFTGTVLVVSHDREFLNRVVTSTLVFEGEGRVKEYSGGYDDWRRQVERKTEPVEAPAKKQVRPAKKPKTPSKKLSYKEQKELESLPEQIEKFEREQGELHAKMADPGFYRLPGDEIAARKEELARVEASLLETYARWEELEEKKERASSGNGTKGDR